MVLPANATKLHHANSIFPFQLAGKQKLETMTLYLFFVVFTSGVALEMSFKA